MWDANVYEGRLSLFLDDRIREVEESRDELFQVRRMQENTITNLVSKTVVGIVSGIGSWMRNQETKRHLLAMNDHMLSDIGLTRGEVDVMVYGPDIDFAKLLKPVGRLVAFLKEVAKKRTIYAELSRMDDHLLADIGAVAEGDMIREGLDPVPANLVFLDRAKTELPEGAVANDDRQVAA